MFNKYKSIIITVIILLLGLLIANYLSKQKKPGKRSTATTSLIRTVETIEVKNKAITLSIPITGKVRAVNKTELYAEVTGVMSEGKAPFKEGVHVKKGDV